MDEHSGVHRLERLLVERGKLASSDLQRVRRHPARQEGMGRALESLGILKESDYLALVAEANGTERVAIDGLALDWAMAEALSYELCEQYCAVPVRLEGRTVVVAMADPGDLASVDAIRFRLGARVRPVVAAEHEIRDGIRRLFPEQASRRLAAEDRVVHEARTRGLSPVVDPGPEVEARLRQGYLAFVRAGERGGEVGMVPDLVHELMAAARLLNEVLILLATEGASHLRLDLFPERMTLRFRRNRRWEAPTTLPEALSLWVVWHTKTLCGFPVGPLSGPVQAFLPIPHDGQTRWFRVYVLPERDGHCVLASPVSGRTNLSVEVMWEPDTQALKPWWGRLQAGVEALEARRLEAAEEHFVASAEMADGLGPSGRVPLAESLSHLARTQETAGRHDDACAILTRALSVKEEAVGGDSPLLVPILSELAETLVRSGSLDLAAAALRRAASLLEIAYGPEDLEVAWILERIGQVAAAQGRSQEAKDCTAEAAALTRTLLEGDLQGADGHPTGPRS